MKRNQVAIKHGFRSGLEDDINESLKKSKKITVMKQKKYHTFNHKQNITTLQILYYLKKMVKPYILNPKAVG